MDYQPTHTSTNNSIGSESTLPSAALVLSVVGIFCSFIPILGTICPSVAIVLALLSRGKEVKLGGKSKVAVILGVMGIVLTIITTIALIAYLLNTIDYTELQNLLQELSSEATYM